MDPYRRSNWRAVRSFKPNRNGSLQRIGSAATAVPASHCVSNRVDNPLCPDGDRCRTDQSGIGFCQPPERPEPIYHSADRQFLLESDFLQRAGLWLCIFVADPAVVSGAVDDRQLPSGRCTCRTAADPLPAVAYLCRISELRSLEAESVKGNGELMFVEQNGARSASLPCVRGGGQNLRF